MKKLALLLGSLLVVGATASAKEIVVAPVEVQKEVVVVEEPVVEEVAVVQEAPATFRPSGYVGLQYKIYGETEGNGDNIRTVPGGGNVPVITGKALTDNHTDAWNRGMNNYARLQTTFGIQITENQRLVGRIRDYTNLESNSGKQNDTTGTETRLRYYYKHNDVFTSRIQYRDEENNSQNFEYMAMLDIYKNEGAFLSELQLQPNIYHSMPANNGGAYFNSIGLNLYYAGNLPLGFTWDGTIYLTETFYNEDFQKGMKANDTADKEFGLDVELYVYRTFELYKADRYNIDFNFEGGYDPYNVYRQYSKYGTAKDAKTGGDIVDASGNPVTVKLRSRSAYSLYTTMSFDLNYNVTESVVLSTGVGAEYRNWSIIRASSASHWRWQPFAYAGLKVKF